MDLPGFKGHEFSLARSEDIPVPTLPEPLAEPLAHKSQAVAQPEAPFVHVTHANEALLKYNETRIRALRRCTRCILPETFPFIAYDVHGVCNYCRHAGPAMKPPQTRFSSNCSSIARKTGRRTPLWPSAAAGTAATACT